MGKPGLACAVVVDPFREAADTLCDLLRAKGYTAFAAYNGTTAIHLVKKTGPRVLVTELLLGDMTAAELVTRLRVAGERPAVVVHTGWAGTTANQVLLALQANTELIKPAEPESIYAAVKPFLVD